MAGFGQQSMMGSAPPSVAFQIMQAHNPTKRDLIHSLGSAQPPRINNAMDEDDAQVVVDGPFLNPDAGSHVMALSPHHQQGYRSLGPATANALPPMDTTPSTDQLPTLLDTSADTPAVTMPSLEAVGAQVSHQGAMSPSPSFGSLASTPPPHASPVFGFGGSASPSPFVRQAAYGSTKRTFHMQVNPGSLPQQPPVHSRVAVTAARGKRTHHMSNTA